MGIKGRCHIVVSTSVFHQIIDTTGGNDGNNIYLLAASTCEGGLWLVVLCYMLFYTSVQAVTFNAPSTTRVPGKSHLMVPLY
jgi:hypothetical protein